MVPLEHVTFWILCALVQISSAQVPVDGGLSEWLEWTMWSCPVTCGQSLTSATRTRQCTNPVPKNGGSDCKEKRVEIEPRTCNTNISCPIDGGFSSWSPWNTEPCSVTCGVNATTFSSRRRNCNSPTPQHGGINCTGPHEENVTRNCGLGNCKVDGGLSSWTEWSSPACTESCGLAATSVVGRNRYCNNPEPQGGGQDCYGPRNESQLRGCVLPACPKPLDGGFSSWSPWNTAPCSVTCGVNATTFSDRRRNCNSPTPQHGGTNCTGPHEENVTRNCGLGNCKAVDARIMAGVVIGVGLVLIFIAVAMTCNFFLHKERSPTGRSCEDNFRRSEFHEYNRMKTGFLGNKHTLSYRV